MSTQPPVPPPDPSAAAASGPSAPPTGHGVDDFFDRIRGLGLVRPDQGRWAAGVCQGVAYRLGVDALLVRGILVALTLVGGAGLFLYGLGWMFLPQTDGRIHAQQVLRGVVSAGFVGALLSILSASGGGSRFYSGNGPFFPVTGGLATVAVVVLVIWWLANHARDGGGRAASYAGGVPPAGASYGPPPAAAYGPPPYRAPAEPGAPTAATAQTAQTAQTATTGTLPMAAAPAPSAATPAYGSPSAYPPASGRGGAEWVGPGQTWPPAPPARDLAAPSRAISRTALGLAILVACGIGLVSRYVHAIPSAAITAGAAALAVLALGVIAAGLSGRRSGGLAPLAILLAIIVVNAASLRGADTGVGHRVWAPTSAAQGTSWDLGVGDARLDLTSPSLAAGATTAKPLRLTAHLGIGQLRVLVPTGTTVRVHATVGIGTVKDELGGNGERSGPGRDVVVVSGSGDPVIDVTADVGIGELDVLPAGSTAVGPASLTTSGTVQR